MKIQGQILIVLILMLLNACDPNKIYESYLEVEGNLQWNRNDHFIFDIEINDTSYKYDQIIAFRHATGYPFQTCSLKIVESDPEGNLSAYDFVLKVAEKDHYLSDCSGDICDLETVWQRDRKFDKRGVYHYEISHTMTDDNVHMVMELGMIVKRKEN